jgi:hypothetical protein
VPTIGQVLNRRSDLSTFVVHLTRAWANATPLDNLLAMLADSKIEARNPHGWALRRREDLGSAAMTSQRAVCFSEAPLEHIYSLAADIPGRQVHLTPYGLAFTKITVRRQGVNPVWYVDQSVGHNWATGIPGALDDLLDSMLSLGDDGFAQHLGARMLPFVEWMGTWPTSQKEFWWEREWRCRGDFHFGSGDLAFVVAPEADHTMVSSSTERPVMDAEWSVERMIASLAGLSPSDVTPFGVDDRAAEPQH